MTFQIEKNVPIPADAEAIGASRTKYPFADLEVGDSFFVPGDKKLTSTIHAARDRLGRVFTYRADTVDGVAGTRIWRAAGEAPIKERTKREKKAKATEPAQSDAAPVLPPVAETAA